MPPTALMMPPLVSETALATTSLCAGVTCGSAALNEDSRNLLTPSTASTAMYSGTLRLSATISAAVTSTSAARTGADQTRICRRDQRSMSTPANGPISEYGR